MIDPEELAVVHLHEVPREMPRNVTLLHGTPTAVDEETGEIGPPTPEELVASLVEVKEQRRQLYLVEKQIEEQLRFHCPEGARKVDFDGCRVEWPETKTYRYEREPELLRSLWDCVDIPVRERERAMQIGKKSLTALKALSSWSSQARDLVNRAMEVVDTRTSVKVTSATTRP